MTDIPALTPIAIVRSTLRSLEDAPRQGDEGAPDAWLDVDPAFARGLNGLRAGDAILLITWLDRADRAVLETHPRNDPSRPPMALNFESSNGRARPSFTHVLPCHEIQTPSLLVGGTAVAR